LPRSTACRTHRCGTPCCARCSTAPLARRSLSFEATPTVGADGETHICQCSPSPLRAATDIAAAATGQT
jgi:hypothetical protein